MGSTGITKKSSEILRLVESVEQLTEADQDRILKIVSLLTRVPASVQRHTQRMLRDLLDAEPVSMVECLQGVDEVIEYLENEALVHGGFAELFDSVRHVGSRWTN